MLTRGFKAYNEASPKALAISKSFSKPSSSPLIPGFTPVFSKARPT